MTDTADTNLPRKKISNYSYLMNDLIGRGFSSQVYSGRNELTKQIVAIKVIDMKMIKGDVHKNLLASEIQVLRNLKNTQNIIDVYDIYTTKNNTYIVTELCDQGDLAKLINTKKTIPEHQAFQLMNQIINGYKHIFDREVVHRDLKPANIFLKSNQVKIADFGFAMKQCESKNYSSYNVGSPIYMPPEALNYNKYSFKSDVWALGIIYYQMLTGKTPWRAKTEKQLSRKLLTVPIQDLIPKGLSQLSVDFLERTLNTNINHRMSPEELVKFTFCPEKTDKQSTKADEISDKSIQEQKNNTIKSAQNCLTRNTVNIPKNIKRCTFLKNSSKDLKEIKNTSLPKIQQHQGSKTQNIISPKNQNFNSAMTFTSKQEQNFKSTNNVTISINTKLISKQLLSQIHFCRFLYKLLIRMETKLSNQINEKFLPMKQGMTALVFERLSKIKKLYFLSQLQKKEYRETSDCTKIQQIVNQYKGKYKSDLAQIQEKTLNFQQLRQIVNREIIFLFGQVEGQVPSSVKEQIIVLDYLITLRQLLLILEEDSLQYFHSKSKMQQIVEGSPSENISSEHITAITAKLRTLKML